MECDAHSSQLESVSPPIPSNATPVHAYTRQFSRGESTNEPSIPDPPHLLPGSKYTQAPVTRCPAQSSGGRSILGVLEIMFPGIYHQFGSNKCVEIFLKEEERKGIPVIREQSQTLLIPAPREIEGSGVTGEAQTHARAASPPPTSC